MHAKLHKNFTKKNKQKFSGISSWRPSALVLKSVQLKRRRQRVVPR